MTLDEEKRRQLEEFFLGLNPDQRREEIYLKPEFRDSYNEITQAHQIFVLPQYYFKNWRHVVGPVAHTLYEELRRRTYYNPKTGERRDSFYATQQELGEAIGMRSRKTIAKALATLEEHGFISRRTRHYSDPSTGRPYRGADQITVYFEIPLTTGDAVELLLIKAFRGQNAVMGKKYPIQHRDPLERVDNPSVMGKKYPLRAADKMPSNVSTSNITNNVRTLGEQTSRETPSTHLVGLLQEKLGKERENRRYYELISRTVPETMILEALAAVSDKYQDSLDSSKEGIRVSKSAYFTGVLKNLARERGIDIGTDREDQ